MKAAEYSGLLLLSQVGIKHLDLGTAAENTMEKQMQVLKITGMHTEKYRIFWYRPKAPMVSKTESKSTGALLSSMTLVGVLQFKTLFVIVSLGESFTTGETLSEVGTKPQ